MKRVNRRDYYWVGAAEGWNYDKSLDTVVWKRDVQGKRKMKSKLCGSFA